MKSRIKWRLATIVAAVALLATLVAVPAQADDNDGTWTKKFVNGELVAPSTPNPYLANLPGGGGDYRSWNAYAAHRSAATAAERRQGPRSGSVAERPGNNDSPNKAQPVFVDTGNAEGRGGIDVIGSGPGDVAGTSTDAGFATELVGSITDALVLPVLSPGDDVSGSGVIGDEVDDPYDFDFFALPDLSAGTVITIDIDTPDPFGDLDPFVILWGDEGPFPVIAANDDDGQSFDSLLTVAIPEDGTYYVSVAGFGAFAPADPYDSASVSDTGDIGSQGSYEYSISASLSDVDYYKFKLKEGDVFGATVFGGSSLALNSPSGELLIGSAQDVTFAHPEASPLPGGGNASLSYVIDTAGWYTLAVTTSDDYVAELRAFRPVGDVPGRGSQIIFLDFDGATVDLSPFGAPPEIPPAELSPLSAFLADWGLDPDDEDAVIDAIVASVVENLETDIEGAGGNPLFDIDILNSRDHAEPTGPLVSKIIVGGTIAESGIPTVGIASSIDVGNFETEEVALMLLDLLSAPAGSENFVPGLSLNSYELADGATMIDFIGVAVGNITAHEAGHFLANWHTDQFNPSANIMDQGGNAPGTFGVGPDGIFGNADDVDVDFGPDTFVPNEGFIGTENTLTSISFGLWSADA